MRSGAFLFDPGCLANTISQVVQLRTSYIAAPDDFNFLNDRSVKWEDTFDADTEAQLAYGKGCARSATTATSNDDAFEDLNPLPIAFDDTHVDAYGVAGTEIWDIVAELCCFDLFDRIHGILRNKGVRW